VFALENFHENQLTACGVVPHEDNNPLSTEMNGTKVMQGPLPDIHELPSESGRVKRFAQCDREALRKLLGRFGLELVEVPTQIPIPGSYWGDEEAGLISNRLLASSDTPLHSILHEACHYICMDEDRRRGLDTDAGGDYEEENAVCYLQITLAGQLPDTNMTHMCLDMDLWGYTFRLGSAQAWFEADAEDARRWLLDHRIIRPDGRPGWRVRQDR
jgi:hypothetical protein